jgi:hypothetical protein
MILLTFSLHTKDQTFVAFAIKSPNQTGPGLSLENTSVAIQAECSAGVNK